MILKQARLTFFIKYGKLAPQTKEKTMKWEDVLKRDDIVGGDLESHEEGDIYRGPIKSIKLEDGIVSIILNWCAKMPGPGKTGFGEWQLLHHIEPGMFVISEILPRELSDNRISITVPGLGLMVIFPKGGSKLDPAKVKGLKTE